MPERMVIPGATFARCRTIESSSSIAPSTMELNPTKVGNPPALPILAEPKTLAPWAMMTLSPMMTPSPLETICTLSCKSESSPIVIGPLVASRITKGAIKTAPPISTLLG
jgi:hypothetical protein